MNAHGKRRERLPFVRKTVKNALTEKKNTPFKTSTANANIIENRAEERATERTAGLNGVQPQSNPTSEPSIKNASDTSATPSKTDKLKLLWSKIDATSKA